MISISSASSVILVSTAIHLTILLSETKCSNTLPPNYVPHSPFSLGNFANNSLAHSNFQNTEPTAALSETTSGINYWSKLFTDRNPGNPTIEETTAYPSRATTLRFRSRTHRRKHLLKHLRRDVHNESRYSYVLILATIHLLILTRSGETLPITFTIPDFIPYLPNSLFTWGISDSAKPNILDTRDKNPEQTRENPEKAKENSSNEDWDWTVLPPSVWTNLLTARDPEKYWLATKSAQLTKPSGIPKSSETVFSKLKTRKQHHKHSRKHHRHSQTKAVLSFVVQEEVQSTTTTTIEIPIVQKKTKLPRSRNPLCYFTALPCAD